MPRLYNKWPHDIQCRLITQRPQPDGTFTGQPGVNVGSHRTVDITEAEAQWIRQHDNGVWMILEDGEAVPEPPKKVSPSAQEINEARARYFPPRPER